MYNPNFVVTGRGRLVLRSVGILENAEKLKTPFSEPIADLTSAEVSAVFLVCNSNA